MRSSETSWLVATREAPPLQYKVCFDKASIADLMASSEAQGENVLVDESDTGLLNDLLVREFPVRPASWQGERHTSQKE